MGLDMYLYAEGYESLSKHDYKDKGKEAFKEAVSEFYPEDLQKIGQKHALYNFLSKTTRYQIGYWRKFNALQGYFIKKYGEKAVNSGVYITYDIDELIKTLSKVSKDLKTCPTSYEKIEIGYSSKDGKLYSTVKIYDSEVAKELLPPTNGFFYGSQYLDDYYVEDIKYSLKVFKEAKKLRDNFNYEIIYDASW